MTRPRQADGRVHGVIVGCPHPRSNPNAAPPSNSQDNFREDPLGDGRWLLIRRGKKVVAPGRVCFPGGAVEVGEDRMVAAVREMKEELGIDVSLTGPIWQHVFDDRPLTLWGFLAAEVGGELTPDPYEVAEILWLTPDEVRTHPDAMPMTDLFVTALEAARKQAAQQ